MSEDEMRAALAECVPSGNIYWTDEQQVEFILPTLRRIVAEELRELADEEFRNGSSHASFRLNDRANALDPPT